MQMAKHRAKVVSTQRKALLRIACAYRTTSAEALQVITGVIPIDLLIIERRQIHRAGEGQNHETKVRAREETIEAWQSRWHENTGKAQWTKRLITDLKPRVKCAFKGTHYGLTQFLTGHGSFKSYTKRIAKTRDDLCVYCGECDTPEHTIFLCPRWSLARQYLFLEIDRTLSADNIIDFMLESRSNYKRIWKFISATMLRKEQEERDVQQRQDQRQDQQRQDR